MPLFALLAAYALGTRIRAAGVLALAAALTVAGFVELDRHNVAPFRTEGTVVPADLGPALETLEQHRLAYAYASYWIAWRISFESNLNIVGAKSSYAHPFARDGRVHPGDPPNDLGIDPQYYLEAEQHRDAAHVFVRGGDVEPKVAPLLRRAGYRRIVSGDFAVWVPPRA
jgi:hypothetical protein